MAELFSVFTPTFNRVDTLVRVWRSLCSQTDRDFEWIVVDDGSTDGTEALIREWALAASFSVRYFRQANSGKHVAMNRGFREARGAFFLIADSDDSFEPMALATFRDAWDAIPVQERGAFAGVTARCRTQRGEPVGTPLPRPILDSDNLEIHYRYHVRGEKWGFVRTELLHRFPCDEGPEMGAFPWGRIAAAGFRTRYLEIVLRTYYVDERPDSMSRAITVRKPMTNVFRNTETLNLAWKYLWFDIPAFIKAALNLARFGRAAHMNLRAVQERLTHRGARVLVALAWLPALMRPVKAKA